VDSFENHSIFLSEGGERRMGGGGGYPLKKILNKIFSKE